MSYDAAMGLVIALSLMIMAVILSYIIRFIKGVFHKGKETVIETVDNNVKPFIDEKIRDRQEDKMLKLAELKNNNIISEDEYLERIKKIKKKND